MGYFAERPPVALRKAVGGPGNDFGGALSASILGSLGGATSRSTRELLDATASSTWPRLATQLKAIRLAETAWTLLRPGPRSTGREFRLHQARLEEPVIRGEAVVKRAAYIEDLKSSGYLAEQLDHPFLNMLRQGTMWAGNPNLQFPGSEISSWMSTTVESVGEWFLVLIRNDAGIPVQWLPIPPHWVTAPTGLAQPNYEITRFGLFGERGIPPQDMAVYRHANPAEPFRRGTGDMNATDVETRTDELASTHLVSRLENHGVPLLLMILAGMTQTEKKEFELEWKRDLKGAIKSGSTKFMGVPQGLNVKEALYLHELQASPVDLDLAQLRGWSRDATLMGNRVPPLAAGEQRSGNRAMALVAEKLLDMNAINPAREGARHFYEARFFRPVADRPAEYRGGWIVMWNSREMTDEGSRDRMMAQVPSHFSRRDFLRVAGIQPQPGDEDIYVLGSDQVVYHRPTNEVLFAPPQPKAAAPFGAPTETPVTKLTMQLWELASLVERLELGLAEQGE